MTISTAPVFPSTLAGIVLPVKRTPLFNTLIENSVAGVDVSLSLWTYPKYGYELGYSFLRSGASYAEFQTMFGFFNQCYGRGVVFQYKDPTDNTAPTDQALGVSTGSTAYQLVRALGGFTEPVFAPDTVTNIKVNGVVQGSSLYTVSNKGMVNFLIAPTTGLTVAWNGTFNWYCRFDADNLEFSQITASTDSIGPLWESPSVKFTTVKMGA